jgi:hypothetical protein
MAAACDYCCKDHLAPVLHPDSQGLFSMMRGQIMSFFIIIIIVNIIINVFLVAITHVFP